MRAKPFRAVHGRAIAILLVITMGARADVPVAPIKTAPAGFDHAKHAQKAPAECTACHKLERGLIAKAPSHATCFGTCHADQIPQLKMREPLPADRVRYCNVCHAETALVLPLDKKAVANTAAQADVAGRGTEHALQLGHDSHDQVACTKCHDLRGPRRGKPHDRCVGCHGDKPAATFSIAECAKCHPKGDDKPRLVRASEIVVTSAFSHAKHATRGVAKQCITCHAGVAATDTRLLPSPRLETCTLGGCHDGKAAFGASASCTKCHQDVPKGKFEVARPDTPFSHAKHASHTTQACNTCHPLTKTGEVRVGGHAACVEGCHEHVADFGARKPTICGACHDGTEPWRPLIADRLPAEVTEFGATLEHKKHSTATACAGCHSLTTTRTELRPPRGHRTCTTAGCHAVTGGPVPQMTACESCHQAGLASTRQAARLGARWSVRSTFSHRTHSVKAAADCVACHVDLTSRTVLSLAAPTKATCSTTGCHDGTAFKVTGTSCTRCHPGSKP